MLHPEKTCDPCGATFRPGEYLTTEQAAGVHSCSRGCASARARGYKSGPGRINDGRGSDGIGSLDYDLRCPCEDCERLRRQDRSALIAAEAARRGWGIATGPRERPTASALGKLAARIRKARLESYEPVTDADFDEGLT